MQTSLGTLGSHDIAKKRVPAAAMCHLSFDDVIQRLSDFDPSSIVDIMTPVIGNQKAMELVQHFDTNIKSTQCEDNRIELITVVMIMKITSELRLIANNAITVDTYKTAHTLMISLFGLFIYHFQLPTSHNNFSFRNFGHLLATQETNVFKPFLDILEIDPPFEHVRIDKFEKIFCLLLIFHVFSKALYPGLLTFLGDDSVDKKLNKIFKFDNQKMDKVECPTVIDFYKRFKCILELADSTLITDLKFESLLNTVFFTSFHKICMQRYIQGFKSPTLLEENMPDESVIQFALDSVQFTSRKVFVSLTCFQQPSCLSTLRGITNDTSKNQNVRDAAMFLLLNSINTLYFNSDIFCIDDPVLLSLISELCTKHSHKILGFNNKLTFKLNLTKETLLPLFELRDQNLKLKYDEEVIFLDNLKIALMNINFNLDSFEDFVIFNNLFIDTGCSLSVGSLFDSIQIILISIIQSMKFNNTQVFSALPSTFIDSIGLPFIPPVYRDDSSFESIFDAQLQTSNFGSFFKLLTESVQLKISQHGQSVNLLEQCLIYVVTIKFKIYQYLSKLNNDTNVLRIISSFDDTNLEEYEIYKFKTSVTEIGMFKSGKSLDYKLLTPAIELSMVSNLSLLILSDNYKLLKGYQNIKDSSLSRVLNEYVVSSTTQFILIYQEFGILIMFKMIRTLNELNLNLITPTATVISKILPIKKVELTETQVSNDQEALTLSIHEILSHSIISSNLVRQFVELFDDGQSKPFKALNKFLKSYPSTLKPSKILKGTIELDVKEFLQWI